MYSTRWNHRQDNLTNEWCVEDDNSKSRTPQIQDGSESLQLQRDGSVILAKVSSSNIKNREHEDSSSAGGLISI